MCRSLARSPFLSLCLCPLLSLPLALFNSLSFSLTETTFSPSRSFEFSLFLSDWNFVFSSLSQTSTCACIDVLAPLDPNFKPVRRVRVRYWTLQRTATLQQTAKNCQKLHHSPPISNLRGVRVRDQTPQRTATLQQNTGSNCKTLPAPNLRGVRVRDETLQRTATYCNALNALQRTNALQHTATHGQT